MAHLKPKSFKQSLLVEISRANSESLNELLHTHSEQQYFHDVLTEVYEEIALKGIQLPNHQQLLIENKLIHIRLTEKNEKQNPKLSTELNRIDSIVFLIGELNIHRQSPDGVFVFICRTIAANMHILKKTLDFTYNVLPWEELEFCLVVFITNIMGRDLIFVSDLLLDRKKILCYLNQFHSALCIEKLKLRKCTKKVGDRLAFKNNILSIYPRFLTLYNDYEVLRDIHSLEEMRRCLTALSFLNDKSTIRDLAIERTLHVIGENLKSTSESPNISPETEKRLLNFVPMQLKNILIRLNNMPYSTILEEKIFLEEFCCKSFIFDLREFLLETLKVLYEKLEKVFEECRIAVNYVENTDKVFTKISEKIEQFKTELFQRQSVYNKNKLLNVSRCFLELKGKKGIQQSFAAPMAAINSTELTVENMIHAIEASLMDLNKISENEEKKEKLNSISIDNSTEKKVVNICLKIEEILKDEKEKRRFHNEVKAQKALHLARVDILCGRITSNDEYQKTIEAFPKEVAETLSKLCLEEDLEEIKSIVNGVNDAYGQLIKDIAADSVIRLKSYKNILNKFGKVVNIENESIVEQLVHDFEVRLEQYFNGKLFQLIEVNSANNDSLKLQTLSIEMLLLDLLEILINKYNFTDNLSYLDRSASLLVGKSLRDYLVHDNPLLETFPFDLSNSVEIYYNFFKEKLLVLTEGVNYGQTTNYSLKNAMDYYQKCLGIVVNQTAMFEAARKGDITKVKHYVYEKNANPVAVDVNGETGLRYAVRANSTELLAYFFKQTMDKNIDELLQVAATNGCDSIILYLLENNEDAKELIPGNYMLLETAIINDKESTVRLLLNLGCKANNNMGFERGSLHLAAARNLDVIADILIKRGALVSLKNAFGEQPLHAAARSGSWRCAEMFLRKGAHVDAQNGKGYTALHLAAMYGYDKTVKVLLEHKAQTQIKNKKLETPLHLAALFGHRNIVELLLKKGASIEEENLSTWTPLHCAAFGGWTDLIKPLFKAGIKSKYLQTPLHIAAYSGHKKTVEAILDCEKDIIDSVDHNGCTALFTAASQGNADTVDFLLNAGAKTNTLTNVRNTAFLIAIVRGHFEAVNLLLPKVPNKELQYGLHIAVDYGRQSVVELLLKAGGNPNFECHTVYPKLEAIAKRKELNATYLVSFLSLKASSSIIDAVEQGNVDIVKILLENGADVNAQARCEIRKLAKKRSIPHTFGKFIDIAKTTLDELVAVENPLHIAACRGHTEIIKILVKQPDIQKNARNVTGFTALSYAAKDCQESAIEMLLEAGVDPNISDMEGITPLHRAVSGGFLRISRLLLWHDATNIHAKTKNNNSALDFAVISKKIAMLEMLLAYDFSADERYMALRKSIKLKMTKAVVLLLKNIRNSEICFGASFDGYPPLYKAVSCESVEITEILLNNGFDVNAKYLAKGHTPLHLAVYNKKIDIIEVLLKHNADTDMATDLGDTPLVMAVQQDNVKIVRLLLKYGADATKTVNICEDRNVTPLHYAAISSKCFELLTLILENIRKKDNDVLPYVNAKNNNGDTPLMWAMNGEYPVNVNLLISVGADVNARNEKGMTPLHCAVNLEDVELVKLLVESGADVEVKNNEGKTAAKLALSNFIKKEKLQTDDNQSLRDIMVYLSDEK